METVHIVYTPEVVDQEARILHPVVFLVSEVERSKIASKAEVCLLWATIHADRMTCRA